MTQVDKDYKITTLSFDQLMIDPIKICNHMGYYNEEVDSMIPFVENELERVRKASDISGGYVIKDVEVIEDRYALIIDNKEFVVGRSIYEQVKGLEKIAIYLCTAGKDLTDIGSELTSQGDLLEGYIIDTIGSVVVENAMDIIHQQIQKDSGSKVTNRYSPGYSEWDIKDQHKLFSIFPDSFCNITLNSSSLMQPTKSLSGFIGIGDSVTFNKDRCKICTQKKCLFSKCRN